MATVSFLFRTTKDKAKLKLRFFFRKDNVNSFIETNTNILVTREYWEKYHNAIRVKDIVYRNMQNDVHNEINAIENFVLEKVEGKDVSFYDKNWLNEIIDQFYNPKDVIETGDGAKVEKISEVLLDWFDIYKVDRKRNASDATLRKVNVVKQLVDRYQKEKRKKLLVKDVDVKFCNKFEEYCYENGYSTNTISRTIVFIKTICNHAKANGVLVSQTFDLVKTKREKVKSIYLNEKDILKIEELEDLPETLDNARDWLLISCYTGQRVSDFMRFEKDMIKYHTNKKGELKAILEFMQQKTSKLMSIPLSSKVLDILDKREGEFPRSISDQKYNDFIKKVCEKAKLNERVEGTKKEEISKGVWRNKKGVFKKWEIVSSHIGRRSFATNNYGKIPTVFLMNMTGHSTEKMFLTYIGKGSKDIAMELSEYFD
ncbi:site-specific integrase [Myroides odoratus]|uniref:site-specific integrase n=1 Tax=Myroides odoratus TaxID=256 RepID=UPI00333FBA45